MNSYKIQLLLTVVAVVASLAGCSSDRQPGPTVPVISIPMAELDSDSLMVGPSGGSLGVVGVNLSIPAGALSETILIKLTKLADGSVDLTPNGQRFAKQVSLSFSIPAGQDITKTIVRWFDPSAGSWVVIPSIGSSVTRTARLAHFSRYDLSVIELSD